jgi:iron(III) transport system substrate-binding protein
MKRPRRISRRAFLDGATALVAVGGLSACSDDSSVPISKFQKATSIGDRNQLVDAAKKEGALTAYIAMAQEPFTNWVQGFSSKYGINLLAQMQGPNAVFSRWSQETRAGKHITDFMLLGGESLFREADKNGWIAEYTPESDGKYKEGINKKSAKWYGLYEVVEPLVFNTGQMSNDEAASLLASNYEALFDKGWKGRVATVVPAASDRVYATYYRLVKERGWDFLARLAATEPAFHNTGTSAVNQITAGQHAVLIAGGTDSLAARAVAAGAPVKFVFPSTSTATVQIGALSANAPHPAAARLFMEWATTDEALASLAAITLGTPGRDGIPDMRSAAKEDWYKPPANLDLNWTYDEMGTSERSEFLTRWAKVFNYAA